MATETISREQLVGSTSILLDRALTNPLPMSYETYRVMRTDPTLALARALSVAPIAAASWGVEADEDVDEDRRQFISDVMMPLRHQIIEPAMYGGIDFGWQAFEKVFAVKDNRIIVELIKPLLQDISFILIELGSGLFAGISQDSNITIPLENSLLISFRVEGTQWYGQSLLENARAAYNEWVEANAGAALYDKKIAGSRIVVHYPPGQSEVDGVMKDNGLIARDFLRALEGAGSIAIPTTVAAYVDQLNKDTAELFQWKVDILTDGGNKQAAFTPRLQYLDVQKVRALLMPERAILEGQFGTKAEAGVHADLALTHASLTHEMITRTVNTNVVDQLLMLNWGAEAKGTVRIVAAPLADEKLAFLRGVYTEIINDVGSTAIEKIDVDAVMEQLGVPISLVDPADLIEPFRSAPGLTGDQIEEVEDIGNDDALDVIED